jgi:sialate O-acetylesterase
MFSVDSLMILLYHYGRAQSRNGRVVSMIHRVRGISLCILIALPFVHAPSQYPQRSFRLAPLIMDNMVVQRETQVPFWGHGTPGREVKIRASWGEAGKTLVQTDGRWMLKLRTSHAGGPYTLTITHDDTSVVVSNVAVGEVWLCSGQSNMEMPMRGWPPGDTVLSSAQEISHAAHPDLRLCTVQRAFSAVPESECNASWAECSSATLPGFSATAFFFGKQLHEILGVPVGLIQAPWGGTAVESWISARCLSQLSEFAPTLQKLKECAEGRHLITEWIGKYRAIDMRGRNGDDKWKDIDCEDAECATTSYDDSSWNVMHLPTLWEKTGVGSLDGIVWFRKSIVVPSPWVGRDLVLELGPVDDIDVTYVNGVKVGSHEREGQWNVKRIYRVPGSIVDSTVVQISVRVTDYQGGGGIYGDPSTMRLHPEQAGDTLSLAGEWRYMPVAQMMGNALIIFGLSGNQYESRPRFPIDVSANTPTTLYNGMIAPVMPYAIRGVIWYQGESNTERPRQYRALFPLLIENWRADFGSGDFPFYFVQIAPYDYGTTTQSQYLREAQTVALSVKNTGMVVTLDIGNASNIHPANKKDVGQRLALWALAKTYGRHVAYSGPIYKSHRKRGASIELLFDHVENGLVLKEGSEGNSFRIAGADRIFKAAVVRVHGRRLVVTNPEIPNPAAVRYAFSNTPEATLFNTAGLPAPSFRTDDWE